MYHFTLCRLLILTTTAYYITDETSTAMLDALSQMNQEKQGTIDLMQNEISRQDAQARLNRQYTAWLERQKCHFEDLYKAKCRETEDIKRERDALKEELKAKGNEASDLAEQIQKVFK